jgi:multiple sugar transport system permease protein
MLQQSALDTKKDVTSTISAEKSSQIRSRKRSQQFGSFVFVIPYLLAFLLFLGFPVVFGLYISMQRWNLVTGPSAFLGLQQYVELFNHNTYASQQFWSGMVNTVIFVLISVPLLVAIPLAIAQGIYKAPLKDFFRSVYFFPTVLSATAIGSLWTWLLATQGGAVNSTLHATIPWLVEQPWAWISIDLATVWWSLGFNVIILYAGLIQIPQTTIEAAAIDGAGPFRTFFFVTLPQLRSVLAFVIIISTIASFNLFAQPFIMTQGGPASSTTSLTMFIYNQGFNSLNIGSATAMAFLMGIILAIIAFIQYRFTGEK